MAQRHRYSPEVRERAVRMVFDHESEEVGVACRRAMASVPEQLCRPGAGSRRTWRRDWPCCVFRVDADANQILASIRIIFLSNGLQTHWILGFSGAIIRRCGNRQTAILPFLCN